MTARKAAKDATAKAAKRDFAEAAPAAGIDVLARVRGAKAPVAVGKAGGRPMLSWVGKRAPASVQAFPAQLVETYGEAAPKGALWDTWPKDLRRGGLLYHGDNKEVLAHLLANGFRGQIKLIYIDPPFDSGADYVRKVELRGPKGKVKLEGEGYTLGEQIQYTDIWANDNYLQFMYERLLLLKELLAQDGSIYLHCDVRRSAELRLIMDEVFGSAQFQNEVVWERTNAHNMPTKTFGRSQDVLLFYTKSSDFFFKKIYLDYGAEQLARYEEDQDGRLYTGRDLTFTSTSPSRKFEWRGTTPPPHRAWGFSRDDLEDLWGKGLILKKKDGTPRLDGLKTFLEDTKGKALTTIWTDVNRVGNTSGERTDYPTQKPRALLSRIIECSCETEDIVLDCFVGSGTTVEVAQLMGRRWICCDINKGAIQSTAKRLQRLMEEQSAEGGKPEQGELLREGELPPPTQLGFTHWRVNDYDLAIQHNEAVNLACEYLGVERLRNDAFFDGLLGKRLVKIVPFGHPLSPVDLEAIRNELDARPDEDRALTVVCLGKELASDAWMAEWNRLRRKKTDPHHIEVIELRSDPKYGGFIQHEKSQARVAVKREGGNLHVEIKDFISPGILQRLAQQSGVVQPRITDWRAMVDSVMIDTAYDGAVFNVAHADVPGRKTDLVAGEYTLDATGSGTSLAIKITDMLGEEVLVVTGIV